MMEWRLFVFTNPVAAQWLFKLIDENNPDDQGQLVDALERVAQASPDAPLEPKDYYEALAAAELIAALLKQPMEQLIREANEWVERYRDVAGDGPISDDVVQKARGAAVRIAQSQRLKADWEGFKPNRSWEDSVGNLLTRLHGKYRRRNGH